MTFLILIVENLRSSITELYEKETAELLTLTQEEVSERFLNVMEELLETEAIGITELYAILGSGDYVRNMLIFEPEKGYALGENSFGDIISPEDFGAAMTRYLNAGERDFQVIELSEKSGKQYMIYYRYLSEYNIFVGRGFFRSEIEGKNISINNKLKSIIIKITWTIVLLLLAGMAVIVITVMLVLNNQALNPLKKINAVMGRIGEGNFKVSLPSFRSDELNNLGKQIDKMARQLQASFLRMEEQIEHIEEREIRYKTLIENLPQKIYLKNKSLTFISCNSSFAADLDISPEEIVGKTDYDFYPTEIAEKYREDDTKVLKSHETSDIESPDERNGKIRWRRIIKVPIKYDGDTEDCLLGIFWDITDRKQAEQEIRELNVYLEKRVIERTKELLTVNEELSKVNAKLEELTLIDPLTNLPNRRALEKEIDQEWRLSIRDQTPLSVIMMDVDHFKNYNDNYGHQLGDECLTKVAECLQENITRPRDFCARYGGEEFIIVLGRTPKEGAGTVAETIRSEIEKLNIKHEYSSAAERITISAGIATCLPSEDKNPEDLIKKSDQALYKAKRNGRNRIEHL